jgi:hypothetical protein
VGTAFSLDGAGANIQVPDSDGFFNRTTPFSVEIWVKASPQQPEGQFVIVDKSHGFADGTGWGLQGNGNGTVSFFFGKGGSSAPASFPGTNTQTSLLDNRWHHLVGVYDGSSVAIYQDGLLHGAVAVTNAPVGNNRNLSIGRSWGGGFPTRHFRGLIDEVSFYTNALSGAEIAGLFNSGVAGKTDEAPMPPILLSATAGSGVLNISFDTVVGKTYHLQYKARMDELAWLDLTNFVAKSTVMVIPIVPTSSDSFYRVYTPAK